MGKAGKFVGKAKKSWARQSRGQGGKIRGRGKIRGQGGIRGQGLGPLAHEFSATNSASPALPPLPLPPLPWPPAPAPPPARSALPQACLPPAPLAPGPATGPPCLDLAHEFPAFTRSSWARPGSSRVGWGYARQMGWVCGGGGRVESRWLFLAHVWP